ILHGDVLRMGDDLPVLIDDKKLAPGALHARGLRSDVVPQLRKRNPDIESPAARVRLIERKHKGQARLNPFEIKSVSRRGESGAGVFRSETKESRILGAVGERTLGGKGRT